MEGDCVGLLIRGGLVQLVEFEMRAAYGSAMTNYLHVSATKNHLHVLTAANVEYA